jgi:hypothetical protein
MLSGNIAPLFLTSARNGGDYSALYAFRFTPGSHCNHCIGGWVGGPGRCGEEISLGPTGNPTPDHSVAQPVA